jgi:hypothetical protein
VRLATRLVGWDIDIVSEDVLKKEIALQMGKMMASGEAVPISALQGVSAHQAETLAEKGVSDVESLAATSVDDLVEFLDVSLDEAEAIHAAAAAIVSARNVEMEEPGEEVEVAETVVTEAEVAEVEAEEVEAGAEEAAVEEVEIEETPEESAEAAEEKPKKRASKKKDAEAEAEDEVE